MKTIILQGEKEKFDNLFQASSKFDEDRLPYEVETRVYLVDVTLTEEGVTDDDYLIEDEYFMNEAERQGTVFTLTGFQSQFNDDVFKINNNTHYIRFINVPLNN